MNKEHFCTVEDCKCPKCGGALYYSHKYYQHACTNLGCMWVETWGYDEVSTLTQEQWNFLESRVKK